MKWAKVKKTDAPRSTSLLMKSGAIRTGNSFNLPLLTLMGAPKLTYLLCLFLLSGLSLHAEIFTVTTPNPGGPGSLRDAIERANANGTREMDYIYFDIPARTRDKTIYIRPNALLPALTSFITIDGGTQPGDKLGVTDAKTVIAIEGVYPGSGTVVGFDLSQANNIFIYGIVLKAAVADRITGLPPNELYGILMQNSSNISIGDIGKGNVLIGWNKAIYNQFNPRFNHSGLLNVKSNYFGIDTDGFSIEIGGRVPIKATNISGIFIEEAWGPFRIGGATIEEANYFNSSLFDISIEGELNSGTDRGLTIINNRFGMGFRDVNLESVTATGIRVMRMHTWLAGFPPIIVSKCMFGGKSRGIAISFENMLPRFLINQNIIGYEENGQKPRDISYGTGIYLRNCENAIIGGNAAGLENIIRYQNGGAVVLDATRDISIFQNSTYCNSKRAIKINNWHPFNNIARPQPFVTINQINELFGLVSGKALPLSTIELFTDDDCPGCEGKTYFARTIADANGNWSYRGSLRGSNIIATASDQGNASSEYSAPQIDTAGMVKPAILCNGQLASICGLKILSGTQWRWENANGDLLGTDTCLNNIGLGTYFLRLAIGTQSCEEVFRFEVLDRTLKIDTSRRVDITHNRCGKYNGSIRGIQAVNADRWQWEDMAGNIVGTDIELTNVPAGMYRFRIFNSACDTASAFFEIRDVTPRINAGIPVITPSTCNLANGSIAGITVSGHQYSSILWINDQRTVVGTTLNINNIPAGNYKLLVRDLAEGCGDSTVLLTVPGTASLSLDTNSQSITGASCNLKNGSIRNLRTNYAAGTINYQWIDANNTVVGNSIDLLNIGAGKYRLKMKDSGPCDTIVSREYEILNTGNVQLDTSSIQIQPTACTRISGSIRGLRVIGATSYEWRNANTNVIAGTTIDLVNVPAGTYKLYAHNANFGCIVESSVYAVPTAQMTPLSVLNAIVKDASCNNNNGSISISQLSSDQSRFTFKWLRDSTVNIGASLTINNLSPATYHLVTTDTNGCEKSVYKRSIVMQALPLLEDAAVFISSDTCNFKTGAITGIRVTGGQAPIQYNWTNSSSATVSNALLLNKVEAGLYQLEITDANNCKVLSRLFDIKETLISFPPPRYDNLVIPRFTDALLSVKNFQAGASYELYDVVSGSLIDKNNAGIFQLTKVAGDRNLLIKSIGGSCGTESTEVTVKVLDLTKLEVPNAFSPNGDGINDNFRIKVTGYFLLNSLKVFNRWGQLIYESKDLSKEWDGSFQGKPLPIATYYWLIDGINVQGNRLRRTGSVTILR